MGNVRDGGLHGRVSDALFKKEIVRRWPLISTTQRPDDSCPLGNTRLIMQRYHMLSVPGDLSIQAAQVRCDRGANGPDRLSPRWSCSKTSQPVNLMAPVIVAQIYAAVNPQDVEDQGLFEGGGVGGWKRRKELPWLRKISLTETRMMLRYRLRNVLGFLSP